MGVFRRERSDSEQAVIWKRGRLTLGPNSISYKGESKPLSGVSANFDAPEHVGRLSSRGWLIVDGSDFQWRIEVQGPSAAKASKATAAINTAARQAAQ